LINLQFLELHFLHREIDQLRDENQNQNKDIAMLKEIVGFPNNQSITDQIVSLIIKELHKKKVMKESTPPSTSAVLHLANRNKRPYRLLPINNKEANHQPILNLYGPPTNCSDLSYLGYTLNGFYLVLSITNNANDDRIETDTVYCAFKQPEGVTFNPTAITEKRIIINSSKLDPSVGAGIHFHARRHSGLQNEKPLIFANKGLETITFDHTSFNIGGGYNKDTGIFTAPKSGIYQITFNGLLSSMAATREKWFGIYISVKRWNEKGRTNTDQARHADNQLLNRFMQTTIKLGEGDEVSIRIYPAYTDRVELHHYATFSGSLLKELVN